MSSWTSNSSRIRADDLSGTQGLLGQVEGRTSADTGYWPALTPAAWRQTIDMVVIDMCTIYPSATRRALPHATVAVDPFHVVQLANYKVHEVRRRVTRQRYGQHQPARPRRPTSQTAAAAQPRPVAL